jgi:hypothetical protein
MTNFWQRLFGTPELAPQHVAPPAPMAPPAEKPFWSRITALVPPFKPVHNETTARKAFANFKRANADLIRALAYVRALPAGLEDNEGLRELIHAANAVRAVFPGPREMLPSTYSEHDLRAFVALAQEAQRGKSRDLLDAAFRSAILLISDAERQARALTLGALNLSD